MKNGSCCMNVLNRNFRRHALPAFALLLSAGGASAEKLVYSEMVRIAPLGSRHSLITWSAGYLQAVTGKPLQEVVNAADRTGPAWTYARLGDELTAFCKSNPKALTRDAVLSVARALE
mgnify:CR=1 FL=1